MKTVLLLAALSLATPAFAADKLAESDYFKTSGSGAAVEASRVFFGIGLTPVKPIPAGALIVAEFPNPPDPAHPLEAIHKPKAGEKTISLRSKPVDCIVNNSFYEITVRLYADKKRSRLLATHAQPLMLKVPPPAMEELKIKECGAPISAPAPAAAPAAAPAPAPAK